MVRIYLESEELPIMASSNHKLYVNGKGWTNASEITPDDTLRGRNSEEVRVRAVEGVVLPEESRVYNIEVEYVHNFYVAHTGVLTHNRGVKRPD